MGLRGFISFVILSKGRTRTALFVGVLFGPFRAQISLILLVSVGRCWCLFWLLHSIHIVLRCVDQGETYHQIASHMSRWS
jgi:hypothetical protein